MARLNSFKDVIVDRFYNDIFNVLSEYVENNPHLLEGNLSCEDIPDEAILSNLEVKLVDIMDYEGNGICFDVVVSAEIEVVKTTRQNRETNCVEQWFRISCSAELDDGLGNFQIASVCVYRKHLRPKGYKQSEYLVPIISKAQLDDVAEKFLAKYYPEALVKPQAISVREVVNRMGLVILHVNITKNCTVFGQIYFSDSNILHYDSCTGEYAALTVGRGTILVDPTVYFMRTVGSMNNTIVHECVHWELHKKFFELEKLYNNEARSISCRVQEVIRPEKARTPLDWMEWQANALAPRILMPAKMTRQKIDELVDNKKRSCQYHNMHDLMESVVLELSQFFDVSKQAIKIRMLDLGYTEAIGVYTYVNDHYIGNYSFNREHLRPNQTFSIGIQDALYEYAANETFRNLVDSGNYVYVDAHFCINDPKYICRNESGYAELTNYARQHVDECCLVFEIKIRKNVEYGVKQYTECILFKNAASDTIVETKYNHSAQNQSVEKNANQMRLICDEVKQTTNIMRGLPAAFSDTLVAHMNRLGITVEVLGEKSLVSTKTIQRIRNNEEYDVKLSTVVAVCIGLQINPILSRDLVRKSGHVFKIDEEHIIYQMLLNVHYQNSIYECNEILQANNCKPLGREE